MTYFLGPVGDTCGFPGAAGMPAFSRAGMLVLRCAGDANKRGSVLPSLCWHLIGYSGLQVCQVSTSRGLHYISGCAILRKCGCSMVLKRSLLLCQ